MQTPQQPATLLKLEQVGARNLNKTRNSGP